MMNLKRIVRRAGRKNTTEHAIVQVFLTLVIVVAAAPYGVGASAAILIVVAIMRGIHNV